MVVVAVGAVYMPLGDHRDGHGATTGRCCSGCSGGGLAVIVVVPMVMCMAVVVTMVMVVSMSPMAVPTTMPRCVGAAFGLKRQVLFGHDEVHGTQHVGQHMVGFDLEVVGLQFDGHMAVARW